MKIKETTERDCCEQRDLKPYNGTQSPDRRTVLAQYFCVHCGQLWAYESCTDAAGNPDERAVRVAPGGLVK
jgi:hypothetical protein